MGFPNSELVPGLIVFCDPDEQARPRRLYAVGRSVWATPNTSKPVYSYKKARHLTWEAAGLVLGVPASGVAR